MTVIFHDKIITNKYLRKPNCKKLDPSKGPNYCWNKLMKVFINQKNKSYLVITHHSRLKKYLFTLKEKGYGFANCICIKISFEQDKIIYDIINVGYPVDPLCKYIKTNDEFKKLVDTSEFEKVFRPKLKYLQDTELYIMRHANAFHNKPINISKKTWKNYDKLGTYLTPLGMYQAHLLAQKINKINKNTKFYIISSQMHRTQHTGLTILNYFQPNNPDFIKYIKQMKISIYALKYNKNKDDIQICKNQCVQVIKLMFKKIIKKHKYNINLTDFSNYYDNILDLCI